jgi:hypothetical protein
MVDLNLPPITISAIDYDRLSRIASAGVHNQRYTVAEMLADELNRARSRCDGCISSPSEWPALAPESETGTCRRDFPSSGKGEEG